LVDFIVVGLELRYPDGTIESEPHWGGILIRIWALAALIFLDSAIVLRIISGSVLSMFEFACSSTKAFYFINQLGWPIAAFLWGIGLIITLQFFLFALEPDVYRWVNIIFITIIVLSVAAIIHVVLVKLILSAFAIHSAHLSRSPLTMEALQTGFNEKDSGRTLLNHFSASVHCSSS
jgi:hypothetical protein